MRKVALVLSILAVPGLAAGQSRKGTPAKKPSAALNPKVAVAGLRVVGPGYGPENDRQRPFNYEPGTTIVLAVRVSAPYGMIELDKNQSSVEIADSNGTALEKPEVDWNPDFTKDGTAALVDLDAKSLPAEGSTNVTAKGSLLFKIASGTKTVKVPGVRLEKGTPVKMGTATLTISEVEDGEEGPRVTFKATKAIIKGIKSVRAKDAKGAPVELSWSHSGGWDEEYETGYRFKTAGKGPVTLEFDLYDGLRDVAVPFDVKAGIGIPVQ